jgi:hypothetical protein
VRAGVGGGDCVHSVGRCGLGKEQGMNKGQFVLAKHKESGTYQFRIIRTDGNSLRVQLFSFLDGSPNGVKTFAVADLSDVQTFNSAGQWRCAAKQVTA